MGGDCFIYFATYMGLSHAFSLMKDAVGEQ
jgi:hypothetical protein